MRTVLMKFIVRGLASGCRDNRASKQREKKSGEFLIWGQKAKPKAKLSLEIPN